LANISIIEKDNNIEDIIGKVMKNIDFSNTVIEIKNNKEVDLLENNKSKVNLSKEDQD